MRICRRVSLNDRPERRDVLDSLGVNYDVSEPPVSPLLWFQVYENDPAWEQLRRLIPEWRVEDGTEPDDFGGVFTKFSKRDLDAASCLQIFARHHGYPMPDDNFGYLEATYDLSEYCRVCGIGKRQMAPFRMKPKPNWGRTPIFQLNWVFDEFFVLPDVWESVFRTLGVGCRPVVDHQTGKELRSVVQIDVSVIAESVLRIAQNHLSEICETCDRPKYNPIQNGLFPSFETPTFEPIVKTQESFGSGASAAHAVIISADLYKSMNKYRLKGVVFSPLGVVDG